VAWYVYVVRCRDGSLYTGIATDVVRRLAEHAGAGRGGAKYLRGRGPLRLVLSRAVASRSAASRIEARMKRLPKARKEEFVRRPARFAAWADATAGADRARPLIRA
jgi:putative endonuclease